MSEFLQKMFSQKIKDWFKQELKLDLSHQTVSIVRITFFSCAFLEYLQLFINRLQSFKANDMWVGDYVLPLQLLILLFVITGFKSRASLIINYFITKFIQFKLTNHYHFDYAIEALSFIFLFSPRPKALSIDSRLATLFAANNGVSGETPSNPPYQAEASKPQASASVPRWFSILLFMSVWLTYFDSVFFKLSNQLWLRGLAFWLPASLPPFSTGLFPEFLEIKWLMQYLAYLALVFEISFPLILFKRLRMIYFAIGLGLHLGITLLFPIPIFGFGFIALLLQFIDWEKVFANPKEVSEKLPEREDTSKEFFKIPSKWGYFLCILVFFCQLTMIERAFPVFNKSFLKPVFEFNQQVLARIMGSYRHPVYIDWHFQIPIPSFRFVDENNKQLGSFNQDHHPHFFYTSNRYWVYQMFYYRSSSSFTKLNSMIESYISNQTKIQNTKDWEPEFKREMLKIIEM